MEVIERIVNQGHGPCSPTCLAVHSTANPGASALNHVKLYSGDWKYAVQYVGDWTGKVYHTMPDDRLAWAVGGGNRHCVNIEVCEGTTREQFEATWRMAVSFCAWYLAKRGWGIDRMISHDIARQRWGKTDHTDPLPYFRKWGKTWDDFVADVSAEMEDDMATPQEVANAVWGYDINGVMARDRLQGTDEAANRAAGAVTRTDDPTGRGAEMTTHEHIKWIAASVSKLGESIEALTEEVKKLQK